MRWFIWWLRGWLWQRWYKRYRKTDTWAKKRAAALKRDRYQCQACGSRRNLQVHHKSYKHVGRELDSELTVLCRECHAAKHGRATGVLSGFAAVILFFLLVLLIVISILA